MNYLSFFELHQEPFSNAPMSRFYYGSQQHGKALVRLMRAIEAMKGLAVLIGDIGTGKTTTARRLLESLPEDQYEAALIVMVQSGVSPQWLVTKIAYQLGVSQPSEDKTRLLGQLYRRLYAIHESGRRAVVLIDEAQMLDSPDLMAEMRGLLNMEIPDQKLLTILLFGLPQLEQNLRLDPPLYQRIAIRCRLEAFSIEATEAYIKHRLKLAGATRMLFTQEAVHAIQRSSSGIPRLINTICDNALFEGFLSKISPITARIIESVVSDLGYDGVTEKGGYQSSAITHWSGDIGHRNKIISTTGKPSDLANEDHKIDKNEQHILPKSEMSRDWNKQTSPVSAAEPLSDRNRKAEASQPVTYTKADINRNISNPVAQNQSNNYRTVANTATNTAAAEAVQKKDELQNILSALEES